MREKKKNEYIKIGLFAIYILLTFTGTASSTVYKSYVDDIDGFYRVIALDLTPQIPKYTNFTLEINAGDKVIWESESEDYTITIVSEQGLWDNTSAKLRWDHQQFSYIFTQPGTYGIYVREFPKIRHQKIIVETMPVVSGDSSGGGTGDGSSGRNISTEDKFRLGPTVILRPVTDVIERNQDGIIELYMDNPSLNDVTLKVEARISVPAGIHVYGQGFGQAGAAGTVYGTFSVPPGNVRTIYITIKAEKTGDFFVQFSGLYWPGTNKDAFQPISLTHPFKVKEPSEEPEKASTEETPSGLTATKTPIITPQTIKDYKKAQIKASYEIGSESGRMTVLVKIENIGDATASFINIEIDNPPELDARIIFGGEQRGNSIVWRDGLLVPGEKKEIKYSTTVVSGKDVEIPLKIKYARMSINEKARMLGVDESQTSLSEEDWEKIEMIIKILATVSKLISGFDIAIGIIGIFTIYTILKVIKR